MTIAISVNGSKVVVPGVYSTFKVEDSLANTVSGARNVVIIGEATKGAPGNIVDIRGMYFTDFASLKKYYGAGPLVDAARNLFTNQASPVFAGNVGRVYCYKTNATSGLAGADILQAVTTLYGRINAVEFGAEGDLIRKQIRSGATEIPPSASFYWVPVSAAADFNLRLNGGTEEEITALAEAIPSAISGEIAAVTGMSSSGGASFAAIGVSDASKRLTVVANGGEITITMQDAATGAINQNFGGTEFAEIANGDVLYIPSASGIAGPAGQNVGAYSVLSTTASSIVAAKISSVTGGVESQHVEPVSVSNSAGSDLIALADMTTEFAGTDWTFTQFTAAKTPGSVAPMGPIAPLAVVSGATYLVKFTVSGRTAGSVAVNLGGVAGTSIAANGTYSEVIATTSTASLTFVPTSDFDGTISAVLPDVLELRALPTAITGSQAASATAEFMVFRPIVMAANGAAPAGLGSSIELYQDSGDSSFAQRLWSPSLMRTPVSAATAAAGSLAVTVAAGTGVFTVSGGVFITPPSIGEIVWVLPNGPVSGPANENVGAWIVTASGSTNITATKAVGGGATVAASPLLGNAAPFYVQNAIGTTAVAGNVIVSSSEKQVWVDAVRQSDGLAFPTTKVGGRAVFAVSYTGSATGTLSITPAGRLTTTCANVAHNLSVNLAAYATLGDLVTFINTKPGYAAKIASPVYNGLSPMTLDRVQGAGISGGVAGAPAYNCRIKTDYYDFKNLIDSDTNLISFAESSSLVFKCGLPDVEATASFLLGGETGATTDADISDGFDAAMTVSAVQVVPLFSRDAAKDIEDGLTDESSTYTIEAVHQMAKAHVATASNSVNRKERFAVCSYHGSFADTKEMSQVLSSERVQMVFQMVRTVSGDGTIKWFAPWMQAVVLAAGRCQSALGTSMLRKSFTLSDVKHIGDLSLLDPTLTLDFNPDTKMLDEAIESGLIAMKAVAGFGIRNECPDLSTRSRVNDPQAWVWERVNVLFICDTVLDTCRITLENYIGNRTSDTSASVLRNALSNILQTFITQGAITAFSIDSIKSVGNGYTADISIQCVEAVEFITLNVLARRGI